MQSVSDGIHRLPPEACMQRVSDGIHRLPPEACMQSVSDGTGDGYSPARATNRSAMSARAAAMIGMGWRTS